MEGILPQEVKGRVFRVVILGAGEMLVEQHRGLIAYETDEIRFRVLDGEIRVMGENLTITSFGTYDAAVQGHITGVVLRENPA